jgi:hypothetical protein
MKKSWKDWLIIIGFPFILLFIFIRGSIGKLRDKKPAANPTKNSFRLGKDQGSDDLQKLEGLVERLGSKIDDLSTKNRELYGKVKDLDKVNQELWEEIAWLKLKRNDQPKSHRLQDSISARESGANQTKQIAMQEDTLDQPNDLDQQESIGVKDTLSPQVDLSITPQNSLPKEVFFVPDRQKDGTFKVSRASMVEEDLSRFRIERVDENLYHLSVIVKSDLVDIFVGDRLLFLEPYFEIVQAEDTSRNIVENHRPAELKKDEGGKFWVLESKGKVIFNKV